MQSGMGAMGSWAGLGLLEKTCGSGRGGVRWYVGGCTSGVRGPACAPSAGTKPGGYRAAACCRNATNTHAVSFSNVPVRLGCRP